MSHDGQRCNLTVYVLYKTSSNLHIMSHASHREESSLFATGKEARETKLQETLLISRVILMGVTLPLKWPESGPVMLSVVLKDAVVWHGSLAADKYSFIEVQEKGKAMIDNAVLNQALSPLSDVTQEDSLTLVSVVPENHKEAAASMLWTTGREIQCHLPARPSCRTYGMCLATAAQASSLLQLDMYSC
ncbi:hypothetical protein O3P69_006462 [Scylla paramamosain]|uniref:Uncharacterized protein n=1 Tax=Scylla paramamosain TaxID=85552 RepID=A0AAW0U661_SCYPA